MYTVYTLGVSEGEGWRLALKGDWDDSFAEAGENQVPRKDKKEGIEMCMLGKEPENKCFRFGGHI